MSKVITIPTCRDPFKITINHVSYEYPAGATVEVPDEVAAQIEHHIKNVARPKPKGGLFHMDQCVKTWEELIAEGYVEQEGTKLIGISDMEALIPNEEYRISHFLMIPEEITSIESVSGVLAHVNAIHIPASVTYIKAEALYGSGLGNVAFSYGGTIAQLNAIDYRSQSRVILFHCLDGWIGKEYDGRSYALRREG